MLLIDVLVFISHFIIFIGFETLIRFEVFFSIILTKLFQLIIPIQRKSFMLHKNNIKAFRKIFCSVLFRRNIFKKNRCMRLFLN